MAMFGLSDPIGGHLRSTDTELYTYWSSHTPKSRVDHVLARLDTAELVSYSTSDSVAWLGITDHRPLTVGIALDGLLPRKGDKGYHPMGKTVLATARLLKAPQDQIEFAGRMEEEVSRLGALPQGATAQAEQLEHLSRTSAAVVRKLLPQEHKGSHITMCSPVMVAIQAQLICARSILKVLSTPIERGGNENRKKEVAEKVERWTKVIKKLPFGSDEQRRAVQQWTGNGPSEYELLGGPCDRATGRRWAGEIAREIRLLTAACGRAEKAYYRRQFGEYVKGINKAMHESETGKVIRAVLQKGKASFNMDRLVKDDGDWETRLEEAQDEVTVFMEKWHAGEKRHHEGIHSAGDDWERLYEDREYFMEKSAVTGVPGVLLDLLWRALQSTRVKLDT